MEKYITDKKTKIATVPIGYADGYLRKLAKHGKMIVDGVKFLSSEEFVWTNV